MPQPSIASAAVDDGAGGQVRVFTADRSRYHFALTSVAVAEPDALVASMPVEGESKRLVAVAGTNSWAALAGWLVEKLGEVLVAALAAIVGELLRRKVDLEKILREIVEQFASLVGVKLREQQLRETLNGLRAMEVVLEGYAAAPDTYDINFLHLLEIDSEKLFSSAHDLGVQGIGALTMAASLRSAIYAETALRTEDERLWETCQRRAGHLATLIPALTAELVGNLSAQFSPVQRWTSRSSSPIASDLGDGFLDGEKPRWEPIVKYFYTYRGQKVMDADDPGTAAAHRQRFMKSTIDRAITDVIVPADAVAQQLDALKQKKPPWKKK